MTRAMRVCVGLLLMLLVARPASPVPYDAPNIYGRSIPACTSAGQPMGCCTGFGIGNCIGDTDFINHTTALERVDALLRSDISQPANYVLAGPASGAAATPAWRPFVLADLPETIRTGTGGSFLVTSAAENPTDGCARWASGILGTTGTACGSAAGAPTNAQYVTAASDAALTAEKILAGGAGIDVTITGTDAGAATVVWNPAEVNSMTFGDGSSGTVGQTYAVTGNDVSVLLSTATVQYDVNAAGTTSFVWANAGAGMTENRIISTTGDSQTRWTTGGANWVAGVDTSATQGWALGQNSLGGSTDVMRATLGGAVSFPNAAGMTVQGVLTCTGGGVNCGTGGSGSTVNVQEDGVADVANATTLNFVDPDNTTNVTGTTPTANINLNSYVLSGGRPGGQPVQGDTAGSGGLNLVSNTAGNSPIQATGASFSLLSGSGALTTAPVFRSYEAPNNGGNYTEWANAANTVQTNVYIWPNPTGTIPDGNQLTYHAAGTSWDAPVAAVASATVCAGTSDAGATVTSEIAAATTAGRAYFLPSGCRVGLGGGAGASGSGQAVSIPAGTKIVCADPSAGFFAVSQRCNAASTYPGAECTLNSQCGGSGQCVFQFGSARFAPTTATTYTMLRDAGGGEGIEIRNCSFWTYQAGPYQRCTGVANTPACRQECDAGALAGYACHTDANCADAGTPGTEICLRRADCATLGGTCSGVPGSASSTGTAKINVLDFARTAGVVLSGVTVYDHFVGDFSAKMLGNATVERSNLGAEITGCTSPIAFVTGSACSGALGGGCCYGAAPYPFIAPYPIQPTNSVGDGVIAGAAATISSSQARGSTTAFKLGDALSGLTRIDGSATAAVNAFVYPQYPGDGGVPGGGIAVTGAAVITKNSVYLGTTNANGIVATGQSLISENSVRGTSGTSIGIWAAGTNTLVQGNDVDGAGAVGIQMGASGDGSSQGLSAADNRITSSPVDTMDEGILTYQPYSNVSGNLLKDIEVNSIDANGFNVRIDNNRSILGSSMPSAGAGMKYISPTFKPRHVYYNLSQSSITNNLFTGGWRGSDPGTSGAFNVNIANNRYTGVSGSATIMHQAGLQWLGNYTNRTPQLGRGAGPTTVCDPSCTGGTSLGGQPCLVDADCGSCASTFKCVIEPNVWVGNPNVAGNNSSHVAILKDIIYLGDTPGGQCITPSTNIGQVCQTAGNTCATGSCTAGTGGQPALCSGTGSEGGRRCCLGAGAVCANGVTPREPWRNIRFTDANHSETSIAGNQIMMGNMGPTNMIDLAGGVAGGVDVSGTFITANNIYGQPTTTQGIVFSPTSTNTDVTWTGNQMWNMLTKVVGWDPRWGSGSFVTKTFGLKADMTTASTTFIDVVPSTGAAVPLAGALAASTAYYFNCEINFSSSLATTGVAFGATGPASPSLFAYLIRLPTISIETGAGTDVMTEEEARGDDGLDAGGSITPSIGVGSINTVYTAAVRGNIVTGAAAGNLTLRVKAENGAAVITVKRGSNCVITEMPL